MDDAREELRRWLRGRQAAARRERQELRRNPPSTEDSVRAACELIAATGRLHGWPGKTDPVTERDDRVAYQQWKTYGLAGRMPERADLQLVEALEAVLR